MDKDIFRKLDFKKISQCLTDESPESAEWNNRIEDTISDELRGADDIKHAVKRLILWDIKFHSDVFDDSDKASIVGPLKGTFIKSLRNIYFRGETISLSISNKVKDLINQWPGIRFFIFEKDKLQLDESTTEDALVQFISEQHYIEYILCAKYRLAQMQNKPFNEIEEALEFSNSEILPIKELKELLCEENGISFLFSGEASKNENEILRNSIRHFLNGFEKIDNKVYRQKEPVTYREVREIISNCHINDNRYYLDYELYIHDHSINQVSDDTPLIVSLEIISDFCSILNSLIGRCAFSAEESQEQQVYNMHRLMLTAKYN